MLANILKNLRKNKEKTQKQIADLLAISQAAYSKYECGLAEPDSTALSKLSEYFGVSVDYLLGREIQEKKPTSEDVSFEEFQLALKEKGLTESDVNNLTREQLSTIADIIKNFKK